MPGQARRSNLTVRRMVAPEPIASSESETLERILARLVALAYAGDHPDLFPAGIEEQPGVPILDSFAVSFVAPHGLNDRSGRT
jgi:hypothetical protein